MNVFCWIQLIAQLASLFAPQPKSISAKLREIADKAEAQEHLEKSGYPSPNFSEAKTVNDVTVCETEPKTIKMNIRSSPLTMCPHCFKTHRP